MTDTEHNLAFARALFGAADTDETPAEDTPAQSTEITAASIFNDPRSN